MLTSIYYLSKRRSLVKIKVRNFIVNPLSTLSKKSYYLEEFTVIININLQDQNGKKKNTINQT